MHQMRLAWMCHKMVKKFPYYSRNFYALLFSIQCSGHYPRASFQPTLALDFYAASSSNLCGPPTWQLCMVVVARCVYCTWYCPKPSIKNVGVYENFGCVSDWCNYCNWTRSVKIIIYSCNFKSLPCSCES